MSSYVWVQLYYKGKNEPKPKGQPFKIKPAPEDVDDLKAAVLPELGPALLGEVMVYAPDTERPFSQDKAIDPGDPVPTDTTSKNPLIVVAPNPKQADGKKFLGLVAGLLLNLFRSSLPNNYLLWVYYRLVASMTLQFHQRQSQWGCATTQKENSHFTRQRNHGRHGRDAFN